MSNKKGRRNKLMVLIVSLVFFLVAGGWFLSRGKEKEKERETVTVKKGDIKKTVTLSGRVDAHEKVTLRFQSSGLLSWVGVKEGDWVKKGQALASLDQRSLKKELEKEMADYLKTRWDWEQAREDYQYDKRWFELSPAARRILEKNQFDLNKAVLDVELADLALRLATISTPIEGIVTKVEAPYAGVNITPATAEIEVVNPNTLYFWAEADEEEVVDLKEGQKGEITLDAYPDQFFSGFIKRIDFSPLEKQGSPSYGVEIEFENQGEREGLRLGMEGEVSLIVGERKEAVFLPLEAIRGEKDFWVEVINSSGKLEKRSVKLGLETDEVVEIVAGLEEGEKVVLE